MGVVTIPVFLLLVKYLTGLITLQTDDRNEQAAADTIAKEEPEEAVQQGDRQEFEAMDIPEHWLPLPIFLVSSRLPLA